jgi:hypothetical protein
MMLAADPLESETASSPPAPMRTGTVMASTGTTSSGAIIAPPSVHAEPVPPKWAWTVSVGDPGTRAATSFGHVAATRRAASAPRELPSSTSGRALVAG